MNSTVNTDVPSLGSEYINGRRCRLALEFACHCCITTIHESAECDDPHHFYDRLLAEVLSEALEMVIGHLRRRERRRHSKPKCNPSVSISIPQCSTVILLDGTSPATVASQITMWARCAQYAHQVSGQVWRS